MSNGAGLQERIQELKKAQAGLPAALRKTASSATMRAVEAAAQATPPKKGSGARGTGTITGELKAHWGLDSFIKPLESGTSYQTILANSMEYASYVNDGHRMDRHFVPGLYINPGSGLLEYDPSANVGLVVGTKTKYVKGEFMADKGKMAYEEAVCRTLDKEIRRLLK